MHDELLNAFVLFLPKDNGDVEAAAVVDALAEAHAAALAAPAPSFWSLACSAPFARSLDSYLRYCACAPSPSQPAMFSTSKYSRTVALACVNSIPKSRPGACGALSARPGCQASTYHLERSQRRCGA